MGSLLAAHSNEILFAVATIVGMISHFLKKKLKNETTVNLKEWFGTSNLPGSLTSIGTALTIIVTALSNGVITPGMSVLTVIYVGLTTGFAVDSTTNKDQASVDRGNTIKLEKALNS